MNGELVETRQTDSHWLGRLVLQYPAFVGTCIATDNATLPTVMLDMPKYYTVLVMHMVFKVCRFLSNSAQTQTDRHR